MKQIPVKIVYEFMKSMVNHPSPTICKHHVCCNMISLMEKDGYVLSDDETRLVGTLCDCSAGDFESNQILDKLLTLPPPYIPTVYPHGRNPEDDN